MTSLPFHSAARVHESLPFPRAIEAIEHALQGGLDIEQDAPRLFSPFPGDGEFLFMPSTAPAYSGVKVLTAAPGNPARGLDKIQGLYLLFDTDTAAPLAMLDGVSLTAIRTPAVAITALKHIARATPTSDSPGETPTILTFGAGLQAGTHIRAAHTLYPGARFTIAGRTPARTHALIAELATDGITAHEVSDRDTAVQNADIIMCCTSSDTPLFDGSLVANHAIILATGTHGLTRREIDDTLAHRADIIVEARSSALRENGNLVGLTRSHDGSAPWTNLADLTTGRFTRTPGRPALYTGVGMSWEDLVLAALVHGDTLAR